MLLNHLKHRACRTSLNDTPSHQDSTIPILKESTIENIPDPAVEEKIAQDKKSNQLMNALLNNKRAIGTTPSNTNDYSPVPLKENNLFKKRVEEYFKQYDNVSLQQKLRTLAPTTINNVTMTANRNHPLTTKPFLVAPFERNTELKKRFIPVDPAKTVGAFKASTQYRAGSADNTRRDYIGTSEGENTHGQDSTLVSNITRLVRGPKNDQDLPAKLEKKLVGLRIPSYTSIDRESVEGKSEKTKRRGESVKHNRRGDQSSKTRRRDSMDSDSCLNFRTASTLRNRYPPAGEEDLSQKEGSLMRYFRAKTVKQRPASTNKAAQRVGPKVEEAVNQVIKSPVRAKTAFNKVRGAESRGNEEAEEKGVDSVNTSFEGFSVLDSFNISETALLTRPTTAMDKIQLKPIEVKREGSRATGTGANTTLLSSQANDRRNGDSMDPVLLNYSDDDDEAQENSADQLSSTDSQPIIVPQRVIPQEKVRGLSLREKTQGFLIQIRKNKRYDSHSQGRGSSSKSSSPKSKVMEEFMSNRGPITERLTEENEQVPSKTLEEKKNEKSGKLGPIKNLSDLVDYVKQKGQQLEEHQDRTSRLTAKFNEALAMADIVQLRGGVVQKPLRASAEIIIPRVMRKDGEEMEEAHEKIGEATEKISTFRNSREMSRQQHRSNIEKAKIASVQRLTNTELEILHEEFFGNENKEIDVERIDAFLKRLKFFSQIGQEIRLNFYKNAIYLQQQKGDYIFHQGDEGNLMYVILKGSVNVKILKKMKDGQSQFINVNSLYDGTHFGELAIMGSRPRPKEEPAVSGEDNETKVPRKQSAIQVRLSEIDKLITDRNGKSPTAASPSASGVPKAKRAASIQCSEETELLAINREKFQEILFSVMSQDLDAKVKVLHQVPFFKNEDSFNLMPIANLLQIRHYKLGQRVVKTGEALVNFYLIAKGKCKVISEITDQYTLDVDLYKDKLKPFKFRPGKAKKGENSEEDALRKTRDLSNPMRRTFDNEPFLRHTERGSSVDKQEIFTKHVFFKELNPGNCFGFRPLLKTDEENRYLSQRDNQAKLSIVAESPNVEVYVLPRASLMLVPERIKNLLLDGIAQMEDFDECDVMKPVKEHQTWRKYQLDLIKDALVKSEHPNLRRHRDSYKAK